jgi:hypothetical protein
VGQNGSANGSNGNGNANGNANGNGNGNSSDTSNGRSATAGDPGNNRPADAGQGRSADVSNGNGASGNKGNTSSADLAEGDSAAAGGNAITASADEAEQGASRDPVGRPNDPRTVALVLARDDRGAAIVRGEILAVSPSDASLAIAQGLNFHVLRQDRLQALGISSVTLAIPDGMTASGALARLRQADPGGNYDYAHVYNPSGGASASTARSAKPTFSKPEPSIRLGMIDGGIEKKHSAVKGATITVQRFAGTERAAGTAHGTAIASLLVGQDSGFSGYLPGAQLYAADIFGGAPDGGSADTIARALNWLAANNIAVTNVSLAGPPNALLEAAVRGFVARGHVLVAAVGNDGPAAPPNYPAAYPGVVAVTSVDASRHLQLDANRGIAQFAALGVDVRAASLPLGYSNVTGTSYATPAVAARFALILPTADPKIATEVRDRLSQGAVMIDGYGDIPTTPLSHSSMSGSAAAR